MCWPLQPCYHTARGQVAPAGKCDAEWPRGRHARVTQRDVGDDLHEVLQWVPVLKASGTSGSSCRNDVQGVCCNIGSNSGSRWREFLRMGAKAGMDYN